LYKKKYHTRNCAVRHYISRLWLPVASFPI